MADIVRIARGHPKTNAIIIPRWQAVTHIALRAAARGEHLLGFLYRACKKPSLLVIRHRARVIPTAFHLWRAEQSARSASPVIHRHHGIEVALSAIEHIHPSNSAAYHRRFERCTRPAPSSVTLSLTLLGNALAEKNGGRPRSP